LPSFLLPIVLVASFGPYHPRPADEDLPRTPGADEVPAAIGQPGQESQGQPAEAGSVPQQGGQAKVAPEIACQDVIVSGGDCVPVLKLGRLQIASASGLKWSALALGLGETGVFALRDKTNRCHWCDIDAAGVDRLNQVDRWGLHLRWRSHTAADALSWGTLVAAAVVPAAIAGRTQRDRSNRFFRNLAIISFAAFAADAATSVVKVTAARERPYAYRALQRQDTTTLGAGAYRSFFSGHTSTAFAATAVGLRLVDLYPPAAASSQASDNTRGGRMRLRTRLALWLPALATGYLRIAADKHFVTDVAVGAGLGYLVGGYMAAHVKPGDPQHGEARMRAAARSSRLRVTPTPIRVGCDTGLGISVQW